MVADASLDGPDGHHGDLRLMAKSWVDTAQLLRPGMAAKLLSEVAADKTAVLPAGTAQLNPVMPPGARTDVLPVQAPQPAAPQATPPPAAPVQAAPPPPPQPVKFKAVPRMTELPGNEPSLASRARPDLPSAAERHKGFVSAYIDPSATNKSLRYKSGSSNAVFHGQLANGTSYIAKPHEGIAHRERFNQNSPLDDATYQQLRNEAPANAQRHDAAYELMSAMGAHHMAVPGMQTNMHQAHQFKGPVPDENDTDQKRMTMAKTHAGGLAHVQEFVPDSKPVMQASPEELDKVDAEHRLHGMIGHLLLGAGDGHSNNVLLHQSGHPVLIDQDATLASSQVQAQKEHFGKDTLRSVFAPGGMLDYQAKMPKDANGQVIPVGTNYPPRMAEVLHRAAEGYYEKGPGALNLPPQDLAALKKNARDLLSYGLEGTLERRHDIDAAARAAKAEKAARLKK